MHPLAEKLMGQRRIATTQSTFSPIMGQTATRTISLPTTGSRLRIGFWPIQSQHQAESAMGIAVLLAFLLERWPTVRVYRLFAKIDGDTLPDWDLRQSQFDVDEWQLDDLDENVAMWGTLQETGDQLELKIEIENDLAEDEDSTHIETVSAATIGGILAQLPQMVATIASYLDAGEVNPIIPAYQIHQGGNDAALHELLKVAFHWELKVFYALAGKAWEKEQQVADYQQILRCASNVEGDLGEWMVANAAARLVSPLYAPLGTTFAAYLEKQADDFAGSAAYQVIMAVALFRADYALRAYDLLETYIEAHPENSISWLALAELYLQGNELSAALDTYQRGIIADAASVTLYTRYADLLVILDAGGVILNVGSRRTSPVGRDFIEGFALIDPDDIRYDRLKYEAVAAYRAALTIEPDNLPALSQLLMQLSDLQDTSFWDDFARLVQFDREGEYLRSVVDTFYNFEDVSPGIESLKEAVKENADQINVRMSLASAYLMNEDYEAARHELEYAQKLSNDIQTRADINRLMLSVDDPEFEARVGDMTQLIDAGNELDSDSVEYLENAIEKAPLFSSGYLLLAHAYLAWDETSDALDVLLDGQKQLPDDPDIAALLARVLWREGEAQLALDCLNRALQKNPQHVPLLALTGQFLFEDGQKEQARTFLARAEAINPRNPVLMQVRVTIANQKDN